MKGFFNKLLRIDLSSKELSYESIPDSVLEKTLGGKGLGVHLLLKENPVEVDPFAPDNVFVIATGPVTDTRFWGHSRFAVFSKSPATGGYGESYCGGTLAPKIKRCGVDAVLMTGKCDRLSYLVIDDSGVSFEDAQRLQGRETFDTEQYILDHCADPKRAGAMVIGPAGENLVRLACIKSDRWRSLGRGGMGAVLGSKNVKGIAFAGRGETCPIADQDKLLEMIRAVAKKGKENAGVTKTYQVYGTPMQVAVTNAQKCFPTRYWRSGYFSKWENLSAEYMQKNFDVTLHGCPHCFLQCTNLSTIKHGRHAGLTLEGPEFETIYAIGGLNEIDSLEEVAWLNNLCDRLGLDTMSAGNLAAFAIEAYKAGRTDFEIGYNQPDRVAELLRLIAHREEMGETFADGIRKAAEKLGLEDMAIHVKGLEPAGFDPRVLKGMGLSYATAPRGACHLRGTFYKAELSGQIDPGQIAGKAELMADYEDRAAISDCLILCRFFRDFILWDELVALVEATTGMTFAKEELKTMANTITNLTREYNAREGIDASFDILPKRFLTEPTQEGARLSEDELRQMMSEYNHLRAREKAKLID